VVNGAPRITAEYSYEPFGRSASTLAGDANPVRYTGTRSGGALPSGLTYNLNRFYDPAAGRFLSPDPIGLGGGDTNIYAYVWNNPVDLNDPSGLGWGVGIEIDLSVIMPMLSGGGGIVGVNLQYTSDTGVDIYWITPTSAPSYGFSVGASCSLTFARGSGDWKGPFNSVGASVGPFGGSAFSSPTINPGWEGFGVGVGVGAPVGAYAAQTTYTPWFGNR
jgi:RHS repeat-associated protein